MAKNNKLNEIIQYNDYDRLKQEILNNVDLTKSTTSSSYLHDSILYRSKECFDILIEDDQVCKKQDHSVSIIAIKYFVKAPNPSNRYYLERLLEKNYDLSYGLDLAVQNNELFTILFNRADKNKVHYTGIASLSLSHSKLDIFEGLVNYLITNNMNQHIQSIFNDSIIRQDNIEGLNLLLKQNFDWKSQTCILYEAAKCNSTNIFNYFFNLYKNLSKEEINNIQNIKNIELLYNRYILTYIDKILSLPIEHIYIPTFFIKKYMDCIGDYSRYSDGSYDTYGYNLLNKLLEHGKITTNILDSIDLVMFDIKLNNKIVSFNHVPMYCDKFRFFVKKMFDICRKYKYEPSQQLNEILKKHKIILV